MKRIFSTMWTFLGRRRLTSARRAAAAIDVQHFVPHLNHQARTLEVRAYIAQLGAESFDEATDSPLDQLIEKGGEEWAKRIERQHQSFEAAAGQRLNEAEALACGYLQILERDKTKLELAEIAVETAVLQLAGRESRPITVPRLIPLSTEQSGDPADPGPTYDESRSRTAEHAEPKLDVRLRPGRLARILDPTTSRTELRRLLDPQDANRVPRWGDPGFRDGTLLAGRPYSTYLHVLALLLAAGADVGAFTQTVQLVLPQADWVSWLVVIGLAAVVLWIAHMVGVQMREASAVDPSSAEQNGRSAGRRERRVIASGAALIWLGIGGLAFWVRYTVPLVTTDSLGGGCTRIGAGSASCGPASGPSGAHAIQAAALFFGLYLATGVAAAVGAYATHNPHLSAYAKALRKYQRARRHLSSSIQRFGLIYAIRERQQQEIDAAAKTLGLAQDQNRSFVQQLKQLARIEIAALAKDPAVTDAFFRS